MGASGAARAPSKPFDRIPAEIQVEILKHLPPAQLLTMIQIVPDIRVGIRSWGLAGFTAQQLVYLHQFISGVIGVGAENEGPEQPRLNIPRADQLQVRDNIVKAFPDAFQKYKDTCSPPLEPDNFNCHYVYHMLTTLEPSDKTQQKMEMETFLKDFRHKNKIVQRFCDIVANLDRHGTYHRSSRQAPNTDLWIYHLLFWLATDYVWKRLKQSKQVNHDAIASHWNVFTHSIGEIFGQSSPISQSFRGAINNDSLLIKYREHINKCTETHLNLIFEVACLRGFSDFDVYPAYMLSLGLDRALSFLNQEPKEIEVISNSELREILAWKKIWTNFEDIEIPEISAPVSG